MSLEVGQSLGCSRSVAYAFTPASQSSFFRPSHVAILSAPRPLGPKKIYWAAPFCSLAKPKHSPYHLRRRPHTKAAAIEAIEDEQVVERGRRCHNSVGHGNGPHRQHSPAASCPVVRFVVPEFVTAPGQVLALVGSGPSLGNWDATRAVRLEWQDGHRWVADVQLEAGWHGALEFKLALIDGSCAVWEPGSNRLLVVDEPSTQEHPMEVTCCWGSCAEALQAGAAAAWFQHRQPGDDAAECTVVLPMPSLLGHVTLGAGARVVLTGSMPQLGDWDPSQGLVLSRHTSDMPGFGFTGQPQQADVAGARANDKHQLWSATVRLPMNKLIEAKIAVVEDGKPVQWEAGSNRSILLSPPAGAFIKPAAAAAPMHAHPDPSVAAAAAVAYASANHSMKDAAVAAPDSTTAPTTAAAAGMANERKGAGGTRHSFAASTSRDDPRRGPGGRAYHMKRGGRGSNPELAELLGVIDSDDEDSAYGDDGRPRGAAGAGHNGLPAGSGMGGDLWDDHRPSSSQPGTLLLNNILSVNGAAFFASEGSAGSAVSNPADSGTAGSEHGAGRRRGSSGGSSDAPSSSASSNGSNGVWSHSVDTGAAVGHAQRNAEHAAAHNVQTQPDQPAVSNAGTDRDGAPGAAASEAAASDAALSPGPDPNGGDFVVLLHWGSTSCSQAVYRPHLQLPHGASAGISTATTAMVHLTVPHFTAQPGQQLMITGSTSELGRWDPSKGVQLKWGPGHRWTGHVELPLDVMDLKVVLYSHGHYTWEPGTNRHVDLGDLVTSGSPTGAGEVHLTCNWGLGPATAALVIPKPPPAVVMEVLADNDNGQGHAGPSFKAGPWQAGRSGPDAQGHAQGPAQGSGSTTVVMDSVKERDQDDALIRLLSFTLSSLALYEHLQRHVDEQQQSGGSRDSDAESSSEQQTSSLLALLQQSVAAKQREVEELTQRLQEAEAAGEDGQAKRKAQEMALAAAEAQLASERAVAAEVAAAAQAEAVASHQRHMAVLAAARSEYEARILDLQRGYEARILDLQKHEARILQLQQQHTQEVDSQEARHQQQLADARALAKQAEQAAREQQQRLQQAVKQAEFTLRQERQQHQALVEAQQQQQADAVAMLEQRHARETSTLLARIKDTEQQHAAALRRQASEHSAAQRQQVSEHSAAQRQQAAESAACARETAERHARSVAEATARLAETERCHVATLSALKLEHSHAIGILDQERMQLQQRALELARSVGSRQLEVNGLREQLSAAADDGAAAAAELEHMQVLVLELEADLAAAVDDGLAVTAELEQVRLRVQELELEAELAADRQAPGQTEQQEKQQQQHAKGLWSSHLQPWQWNLREAPCASTTNPPAS